MPTAPTADELLRHPLIQQALLQAWTDSLPNDLALRHEEGGWIYMDVVSGTIHIERARKGSLRRIDLSVPLPVIMHVVVAKFHTHPNPSTEGWDPEPSEQDRIVDEQDGVPDLIVSDRGVFISGPESRRGGLTGPAGYPN
jgi:hypothetical protein